MKCYLIFFARRYTCFHSNVCSLWMSFGVYIMGILFQTSAFVSFFLISHGYCITCHRLSLSERRTMAALGCVFYLTLVGYRASVPYFTVSFPFLVMMLSFPLVKVNLKHVTYTLKFSIIFLLLFRFELISAVFVFNDTSQREKQRLI